LVFARAKNGELEPQLIELQGFPTMFAYQVLLPELSRKFFELPETYDHYLGGLTKEAYLTLLKKTDCCR
jgi:hypothetical protein